VEWFIYFGANITNSNSIDEEIMSRLNMGNVCYHLKQNLLSFSLLSKSMKIKTYRTVTLPVLLYGLKAWSLTMGQKHRLRVFENRVLKKIFGSKRNKVTGKSGRLHNEELNYPYS
jgi:hypothetical protein